MNWSASLSALVWAVLVWAAPFASLADASERSPRIDLSAPAMPGQFLIKFKSGTVAHERAAIVGAWGGRLSARVEALDVDVVIFDELIGKADLHAIETLVSALQRNPQVEYIEPDGLYAATFTPNDPLRTYQWGWTNTQAYYAWDINLGNTNTVIAIVDSGIQSNHPDLASKLVAGYDFIDNDALPEDVHGHGTHVAGTAGAITHNGVGVAGMCPNCRLMPVRVLDGGGFGSWSAISNGITWAADQGAKVINLSLGGSTGSTTLQSAIDYAWNKGAFLACAAGNSGSSSLFYPAGYTNCFAVAATSQSDAMASFSNHGTWVEIAAPGGGSSQSDQIYSTAMISNYMYMQGTSMASPHVAGAAGLLASAGQSNVQIRDRLCSTADAVAGTGTNWTCGRLNVYRAVYALPPPGGGGGEALVNGGFESGQSPWYWYSDWRNYTQMHTTAIRHTGTASAWLGGRYSSQERVYQQFVVPTNARLTFWWYMTTEETGTTPYDYLYIDLLGSTGGLVTTMRTLSNTSGAGAWRQETINLLDFDPVMAGKTRYVRFRLQNNSARTTSFYIDDVSVRTP
jgi:thermitase